MNIAVACGLVVVLLVIMLLAGVPIAVALAVSSICAILPVLDTGAMLTRAGGSASSIPCSAFYKPPAAVWLEIS